MSPLEPNELCDGDFTLNAAWFFSGKGDPLPNVVIEVTDGIISDIRQLSGSSASRVFVIPPLVNSHTHLELSDCREPIPAGDTFPEWIRKIIAHRSVRSDSASAIETGLSELAASGTGIVADTVPADMTPVNATEVRSFVEYIGMSDDRVAAATEHAGLIDSWGDLHRLGISPHAPYSVRVDLLDKLTAIARQFDLPMMMHLAETREELELLATGTGPFATMLRSFGLWQNGLFPQLSVCDYIDRLAAAPRALFAHGNYFGDAEIDLLVSHPNATVVFCPRTHTHFGHDAHPWQRLLDRGINVAIGTDSRASNPDLSIWNEALTIRRAAPTCSPQDLLSMLTANGARALSGSECTLEIGGPALFSVLQGSSMPVEFWSLFDSATPSAACIDGSWRRG